MTIQRWRSVLSLMLAALIVLGLPALSAAQLACPPDGDVDQSGSVTAEDALLVFQQALGLAQLSACQQVIADVYPQPAAPDGSITASDALCIFQKALSLPSCLDILPPANQSPVADAGPDQTVIENISVALSGSGTDQDGTVVSYSWEQTDGPTVTLTNAASATATFIAPDVSMDETLTFRLTVTDDDGATGSDEVVVTVKPANQPPMVDAGADQSVDAGTMVLLSGTASDPDGTIASYLWEQMGGTMAVLSGATDATAMFTAPDVLADETLTFRLTVTDDDGATGSDEVVVTVKPANQPPMVDAGVDQSADAGTMVLLSGTASDLDGRIVSYLWEQTSGTMAALSGATDATAMFTAPDVAAGETLTFRLTVTDDDGSTGSDEVLVTVSRANQSPTVETEALPSTADAGAAVTLVGTVIDSDGMIVSYLWEQTGGTIVALSGATDATAMFTAPDVSADETLTFRLTVTDNDGASATATVTVTVRASPGDFFSSSVSISGKAGRSEESNNGASLEDGEPRHAGNSGGASVWWTWTAPQTAIYEVDTRGSDFDTLLAVYIGDSLERLTEVVSNDDIDRGTNRQSAVRLSAQQDHVYHIAVDGYGGETGAVVLNWRLASVPSSVTQFDDNVVVIRMSGSLTTDPLDFRELAQAFYGKYEDAFDFLIFISNTPDRSLNENLPHRGAYYGIHLKIRNAVDGIGRPVDTFRQIESTDHLKSVIHLNYYNALEYGPSLHEIMHEWANFVVPTTNRSHWGFSSANGQLGGFDLADLVEHSPGKYSAGRFGANANGGNSVPYSPIELYLAGFVPPSEVPDLWVAKDGAWTDETDESGNRIFTASDIESYSIKRIVSENGVRDPDFRDSQKHFNAAAILLVDDMYPATKEVLEELSASVRRFAHPGSDKQFLFNFWEATGGRATLAMDELVQRPVGAAPLVSSEVPDIEIHPDDHDHVDVGIDWSARHHEMTLSGTHGLVDLGK